MHRSKRQSYSISSSALASREAVQAALKTAKVLGLAVPTAL
jgi:hypothetical protein